MLGKKLLLQARAPGEGRGEPAPEKSPPAVQPKGDCQRVSLQQQRAAKYNCLKWNAQATGRQEVKAERVCSPRGQWLILARGTANQAHPCVDCISGCKNFCQSQQAC